MTYVLFITKAKVHVRYQNEASCYPFKVNVASRQLQTCLNFAQQTLTAELVQ